MSGRCNCSTFPSITFPVIQDANRYGTIGLNDCWAHSGAKLFSGKRSLENHGTFGRFPYGIDAPNTLNCVNLIVYGVVPLTSMRSEERRVGKGWRANWG